MDLEWSGSMTAGNAGQPVTSLLYVEFTLQPAPAVGVRENTTPAEHMVMGRRSGSVTILPFRPDGTANGDLTV